jgi:cobalt transporter subunit CbtA
MTIFRNVVFVAALAGLVAGLAMTAMQYFATTPLILEAEVYEEMAEAAHHHDEDEAHGHAHEGWMPEDGIEREFYTGLANIVAAVGFALLLIVASEFAGGINGWRQGLYWGFGGFAAFTLAPGLGLPPELPGMPAGDLMARQVWWLATVAATAGGLALIAFGRRAVLAAVGVALIVAPHLVGAPQPVSHESPVPVELHSQFVTAVTLTSLVFWMVLGATLGLVRRRFAEGLQSREQGSLA